ncbi:MAG: glutamate-1-semialdehyde 2,1-aminomutase [Spirochaetes bacterium]|nr:glutamate-1-semialdehyde 2,1-aminomutase [Spirochaetota bacterium]
MTFKFQKSKELYDRAFKVIPGGVNSPVRAFKAVGGTPIFIERGSHAHIYDADGNEYIDYCMSWGPLILGHADNEVIESIIDTAKSGTSFGTCNHLEVKLAEHIVSFFPSVEKVRFVNSGTEAVMSALRLARGYTGRDKIIKFDGCYHGHADYLLVAAGSGLATFGTPDSDGVTRANAKDTIVLPFNEVEKLEKVLKRKSKHIAAIIMEPVPCNYGLIRPLPGYLQKVRELCDKYEILLIFDEVITGLRLARGGAQEYYGVMPDLTTLGKIIGGGLPVGAYGGRSDIMSKVAPEGPVYQAGTLSGNPLAMAAGLATLQKLERINAWNLLREKATRFSELVNNAISKYQENLLFVALESIFSFAFTRQKEIIKVTDIKNANMKLFAQFHREMLKRNIYLAPSGFEVGFLSTAHTNEDFEKTAQAIGESLKTIFD